MVEGVPYDTPFRECIVTLDKPPEVCKCFLRSPRHRVDVSK